MLVLEDIADHAVIEAVCTVKQIGQEKFEEHSNNCLIDRIKTIDKSIKKNKLHLFGMHRRPKERKHL